MQILKILVTGGTGFIGSHLCEALIQRGHHVTILLRPDDNAGWVSALPLARAMGDITDKDSLTAAVSDAVCVFHLAAVPSALSNQPNEHGDRLAAPAATIPTFAKRRLPAPPLLAGRYSQGRTRLRLYITRHRLADGLTLTARWYADQGLL